MLVATKSFVDPTDGQPITAGSTYVAEVADVARMFPENFKPATGRGSGPITRVGGTVEFGKPRPHQRAPKRPASKTLPFGYSYKEAELFEHYVDYAVDLGTTARETILDAIKQVRRSAGDVEAAGWLYAPYRPSANGDSTLIAYATVESVGNGSSVYLGDPFEALGMARSVGLDHLHLAGCWHSHPNGGSELPSMQDARAWAGTMDMLGRCAYTALIVSPAESGGWMYPKFSAWVAGRYGYPSQPVVGRARMMWE
jgi:hypothetical protein